MSQLQNKIEQTAKEYLLYKNLFEERKKAAEEKRKEIGKTLANITDQDKIFETYFEIFGTTELLAIDMNQMKIRLYHYIKIAEDLVEIPQEIKGLVEDYSPTFLFSTEGEIVNKPLYEQYRQQYIQASKEMKTSPQKG